MKRMSKSFSLAMFWIENSLFIPVFVICEIILMPLAFLKTTINILLYVDAFLPRKIFMLIVWLAFGIFLDMYLLY